MLDKFLEQERNKMRTQMLAGIHYLNPVERSVKRIDGWIRQQKFLWNKRKKHFTYEFNHRLNNLIKGDHF